MSIDSKGEVRIYVVPSFVSALVFQYPCRTLYEEEEQESFHESLTLRIRSHEKDIEKMCNKNYQGFIESVSELLKVRSDAAKLKVSRGNAFTADC